MRVIGIDPGTICCGYGIIEAGVRGQGSNVPPHPPLAKGGQRGGNSELTYIASGDIRMNKRDTLPERLKVLYNSLRTIICEYKPSHLCIEKIFYHKSIVSAFALGSTRGIAMLLAAENNLPVFEYNSTELKMALTGYGRAEKRQVKEMVIRILNLHPPVSPLTKGGIEGGLSEDITDALALCICHIHNNTGYNSK